MDDGHDIDAKELQSRVVYALVQPAVRLAEAFELPIADLMTKAQTAYFHHLRDRGWTLRRIASQLGVSERTAKRLAKQLREHFLDTERRYDLPVRIELMLWAVPMSRVKVKQVLSAVKAGAIDAAVDRLIQDGRVEEEPGRTALLKVKRGVNDLVRDTWLTRIGGLNSFLGNLSDAVFGRFFRNEPKAFARTMSFLVAKEDVAELDKLFSDVLVPAVQRLDDRAKTADDREAFRMSVCWAPYDYLNDARDDGDDE